LNTCIPTRATWGKVVRRIALPLLIATGATSALAEQTTGNLLNNGDAEVHHCTDDWTAQTPVPGWRVVRGAASVLCYSAFAYAGETPVLPDAAAAGKALFGAPGSDTAIEQTVDLAPAAAAIDTGTVRFTLSGWLGGWQDRPERATLTAVFLDEAGRATGSPVVLADAGPQARGGQTGMLALQKGGSVPRATRRIVVTVDFLGGLTSYHNAYADQLSLTLTGEAPLALAASGTAPPSARLPPLDHVYVVMMENTNYADIVHASSAGNRIDSHMPFLASLARQGVLLTDAWATYHPSDQNYVAMVAGDTYRYGSVYYPNYNLTVRHLGDAIDAAGKTWRAYVQNMKTPCNLASDASGQGYYAPDDQPFAQFLDVIGDPTRCTTTLRDLSDFESAIATGRLPDFAWIAADGYWDGEMAWWNAGFDMPTSLSAQDQFLQATFAPLLTSAAWQDSRSLLIVTWDESLGWGWPDNHVATFLVGSPGLLRAGSTVDRHYDGYGILRSIEAALRVDGLDRFDRYAEPLNDAFAFPGMQEQAPAPEPALRASASASTRGSLSDTFGQVGTPAAVDQGSTLILRASSLPPGAPVAVALAPIGRVPDEATQGHSIDAQSGVVSIPTEELAPGFYGAWLLLGDGAPAHAALPVQVLPRPTLRPGAPGVEIVGAPPAAVPLPIREDSNVIVRYCRPAGSAAADTWIGIFPSGTPASQRTQDNANLIGFVVRTPGAGAGQACGEAMAFASELTPAVDYDLLLLQTAADGSGVAIGRGARFVLTHALPQ